MTGLPKFRVTWHYTIHKMGSRRNGESGSYSYLVEGPDAMTAVANATLRCKNTLYNRGALLTKVEAVSVQGWTKPDPRTVAVKSWQCGGIALHPGRGVAPWQVWHKGVLDTEWNTFERAWRRVLELLPADLPSQVVSDAKHPAIPGDYLRRILRHGGGLK